MTSRSFQQKIGIVRPPYVAPVPTSSNTLLYHHDYRMDCNCTTVYLTYLKEGGKDASLKSVTNPSPLQTSDYVEITMVAQEINLPQHKLKFYAYYGFQNVGYPKGKKMQAVEVSVPVLGYPRLFPFDSYNADFEVSLSAMTGNTTDQEAENIPVRLVIYWAAQALTIKSKSGVYHDYRNMIVVDIQVKRASTALFFSIFIMLVMWGLALTMVLSFQIVMERRQVAPNLTIIGVTMMFALPALREFPAGRLFMIAVTAIINILIVVLRWKHRPASALPSSDTKAPDAASNPSHPPTSAPSQATSGESTLPIHHRFSANYIDVTLVAQNVNLVQRKLSLYAELNPYGKYKQGYSELTINVTGYYSEKNMAFKKGKRMQSFDLAVPTMGYPRLYPFDDYDITFEIYLKEGDLKFDSDISVPIRLTFFGSIQSFKFEIFTVVRTNITLFFPLFIMLVMWFLAFTMSTLAYQIGISRRDASSGLLNAGIGMLFALPALRNSQPGVPALGCALDVSSFLW
ncbi:hypothetical protein IWQ61_007260 [Dispira simplex]|nr:hypothetical protein IWQ61_007260 [Dispira simplex]